MLRTRQVGYNPSPFSMEQCSLYLPFGEGSMQGTTFRSYDAYHHLCTPTGTTWGIQGRTLDGASDIITVPNHAALKAAGSFSIVCWVKVTSYENGFAGIILGINEGLWYFCTAREYLGKEFISECLDDCPDIVH